MVETITALMGTLDPRLSTTSLHYPILSPLLFLLPILWLMGAYYLFLQNQGEKSTIKKL